MKPEEQRIAVAKWCGWTLECSNEYDGKCWHLNGIQSEEAPPDYPKDLNAMHSAVMSQDINFRLLFEHALQDAAKNLGVLMCELPCEIHAKCFLQCKRD